MSDDRKPEPSDGPDYHADLAAWASRQPDCAEVGIRRDERHKIADLLEAHADTLATFALDRASLVILIAFMLRLDAS